MLGGGLRCGSGDRVRCSKARRFRPGSPRRQQTNEDRLATRECRPQLLTRHFSLSGTGTVKLKRRGAVRIRAEDRMLSRASAPRILVLAFCGLHSQAISHHPRRNVHRTAESTSSLRCGTVSLEQQRPAALTSKASRQQSSGSAAKTRLTRAAGCSGLQKATREPQAEPPRTTTTLLAPEASLASFKFLEFFDDGTLASSAV